ncbi:vacuolar-sorting protein SNF7 [Thozetella sp. PMI_491]|nr:vacuolar-sorting protein SNF7 [Thozetella sp. PMI_491]
MSGVWGWFGGGNAQNRKDSPKNAIVNLREQLELLRKREKHLQGQMDEQHAIARKNVATNKAAAKKALERKKMLESYRVKAEAQMTILSQQIFAIESANINRATVEAMERGAAAMKQMQGKLTPGKVDGIMETVREQNAIGDEIAEVMQDVGLDNSIDETDLEWELEQLQQEGLDEQMLTLGLAPFPDTIQGMPVVTSGIPVVKDSVAEDNDDEAEMRKLEAEMAM